MAFGEQVEAVYHDRTYRGAVLLVLSGLFAGAAQAQSPKQLLGEKYALLVGVRQYDKNELRSLPYTESDVVELSQALQEAGYRPENIVLLTQTMGADNVRFLPLAANIRKELRLKLRNRNHADSVLVAFAGHGVQFKGDDEPYFCPMDAKLDDKSTLISLSEVYKELDRSRTGVKLLLADACRNDPLSDNSRARQQVDLESVTRPQQKEPPGGVQALFSCAAGEKAFENEKLKHGVFFYYLIEGLRGKADLDGDQKIDLDELVRFTKKRVPDFVAAEYGQPQTPEERGRVHGLVMLVSVGRAKKSYLGVESLVVTPQTVKRVGLERPSGAWIEGVHPGSPAETAGLLRDDVVLGVDGKAVASKKRFLSALSEHDVGARVALEVFRKGRRQQVEAVMGESPADAEIARGYGQAAERGEAWAQRILGAMYASGRSVAQNDAEAVKWYRRAAEQGDALAQANLGHMYLRGRGVPQDGIMAAKWYRQAADEGNAQAQYTLGLMYANGGGPPKDMAEALKWFRKAADQGHPVAQCSMGFAYAGGKGGVSKDEAEAFRWWRKAAGQGYPEAQCDLGSAYARGLGIAKDEAEAVIEVQESCFYYAAACGSRAD
jgi:hypothetical protein